MKYRSVSDLILFAVGISTVVFSLSAFGQMLEGMGKHGDWRADAPGVRHRITVKDLPAPFATKSVSHPSKIVRPPLGAKPEVPRGFAITKWADDFKSPRYLLAAPNGDIFVVESYSGEILVLRDADGDGTPEMRSTYVRGLKRPFGLALFPPGDHPRYLYVGETDSVIRFPYKMGDRKASGKPEKVTDLSSGGRLKGGGHWTRDVTFSNDGEWLFASVGSKTNVDERDEPVEQERARIFIMKPDGSEKRVYASGIRNPVGIAVHPQTGELWASVNERDGLGNDLVPDYITSVKDGGFYGWPWYYMGGHLDPRHKENPHREMAGKTIVPDVLVQPHSAPLTMVFYTGKMFPDKYRNDAFAAFHGSWNREPRTGYKVVRVPLENGRAKGYYEDFVTGFVLENGDVWGRPVGLTVAKDGALLMSEDGNNTIWRISSLR